MLCSEEKEQTAEDRDVYNSSLCNRYCGHGSGQQIKQGDGRVFSV